MTLIFIIIFILFNIFRIIILNNKIIIEEIEDIRVDLEDLNEKVEIYNNNRKQEIKGNTKISKLLLKQFKLEIVEEKVKKVVGLKLVIKKKK